jgi:hypothetical protein
MEIDTLFDLPAHPLVVHAAVVPASPGSDRLAQQSVESLEGQVKETEQLDEHTNQGDTVLPWAIALTVVSAAVAAEPYLRGRLGKVPPRVVAGVLIGASVVVVAGATWTVIEVGHSGATAVWHDAAVRQG